MSSTYSIVCHNPQSTVSSTFYSTVTQNFDLLTPKIWSFRLWPKVHQWDALDIRAPIDQPISRESSGDPNLVDNRSLRSLTLIVVPHAAAATVWISVVTVSHLARSVDFGSVLRKKPRFRYGSVFILLRSNSQWLRRRPWRWQNKSNDGWWVCALSGWSLTIDIC